MTKIWAKTDIKRSFFALRAKKGLGLGRSPPQELEEGPRSGPHLLVMVKAKSKEYINKIQNLDLVFWNVGRLPENVDKINISLKVL